jgi:hypothetical protein
MEIRGKLNAAARVRGEEVVIPFIEKTWFLWWILATLIILRWCRLFLSSPDDSAVRNFGVEQQASTSSDRIASEAASRLSA